MGLKGAHPNRRSHRRRILTVELHLVKHSNLIERAHQTRHLTVNIAGAVSADRLAHKELPEARHRNIVGGLAACNDVAMRKTINDRGKNNAVIGLISGWPNTRTVEERSSIFAA